MSILLVIVITVILPAQTAIADERDDRIQSLEKRVEQLEKLLQGRDGKPASPGEAPKSAKPAKPAPSLAVGASGFSLRSADTNFTLHIRGLLQADSRWYVDDGGISDNDGFVLRRVRPILEGTVFRDFDFLFTPEFGGSSPAIRDAWLNYEYSPALQLRVGKMKPPGGLERRQSVSTIPLIERAMVSGLWPSRDLGVMFHGELWPAAEEAAQPLASSGARLKERRRAEGKFGDR